MKKTTMLWCSCAGIILFGLLIWMVQTMIGNTTQITEEPPYDYKFQSGAYTLYCKETSPDNIIAIDYEFTLYRGNKRQGDVLTFQSDTITTYHYDRWWDEGKVDGVLTNTAATIHVGFFKVELDFKQSQIQCTRDYKEDMLGNLLASNEIGDKQIYDIFYDIFYETFDSKVPISLTDDIVLYDTKTAKIDYISDGTTLDQILFDHQNNILLCCAGGVFYFDGTTCQSKGLPFEFPHQPNSYDFVDFLYDRENQTYIIAWAEQSQWIEMIPEETTSIEGVPNIKVSVYAPTGSLLIEYDTKHIIPRII